MTIVIIGACFEIGNGAIQKNRNNNNERYNMKDYITQKTWGELQKMTGEKLTKKLDWLEHVHAIQKISDNEYEIKVYLTRTFREVHDISIKNGKVEEK